MKLFLAAISILCFSAIGQATELTCTTTQLADGSVTKISSSTYQTTFGSVKRLVTIKKVDPNTGLEVQGFTHTFKVNDIKQDSEFLQISGIKMVNTGGGITGMTNFDGLTLSVRKATKAGSLRVQPTYSTQNWSLKFTCSSLPSL